MSVELAASRERLRQLLKERSVRLGGVTLASGQQSDFYVDGRMTVLAPEGAHLIGEILYEETRDDEFEAVGGLAVGAVPVVSAFVLSCYHHGRSVEGIFARSEQKKHGTQKLVEGKLQKGDRVLMVDDVITSGGSTLKAIDAVEAEGGTVDLVFSIVDRDAGARELFADRGYEYRSIFTRKDLLD